MNAKAGRSRKKKAIIAAAALAAAVVCLLIARFPDTEATSYGEAAAEAVTMEQTLTAAGQIKAAESESIAFSTSKTFAGMCVEEGDAVRKGQHLISYSDGTYEDAPDDGVVKSIDAPRTGRIGSEDNVLVISYTDELILEITVPENEIGKVNKGEEAKVTVNADTSKTFRGTITSVKAMSTDLLKQGEAMEEAGEAIEGEDVSSGGAAGADSSDTAFYTEEIKLTNDGTLKTGMSGSCTITVSSRKSVLAVPIQAVHFDENDEAYVEIMEDDSVTKRSVTTGESDADYVEISDGLAQGDRVRIEVHQQ